MKEKYNFPEEDKTCAGAMRQLKTDEAVDGWIKEINSFSVCQNITNHSTLFSYLIQQEQQWKNSTKYAEISGINSEK